MKKLLSILILMSIIITSCNNNKNNTDKTTEKKEDIKLSGAGATFPMPFYNMAFKKYLEKTGAMTTYGGIGSGGGIRSLTDKIVDFGATDAYLSDEELVEMPSEVLHIPTCLGAVVIAYNLPEVDKLNLSPALLSDIFMGKITKWNDKKIKAENAEAKLPDLAITVVYRSDGSGTTYIFSDYMSKISENWDVKLGKGKSLNWVTGIGAKGNPGVSGTIKQTQGAIGYIGSEYAIAQKIPMASLKNLKGEYIYPTLEAISLAAKTEIPTDTRAMITNSDAPGAYPISGFTWLIIYKEQNYNNRTEAQAKATVELIRWLISSEAQDLTVKINYSPIPAEVAINANKILDSVTFNGKTLK